MIAAAESVAICKNIIESLGKTPQVGGIYPDDNSGCCYHPGQQGWYQVMMKGGQPPKCSEVNGDLSRQRVCACSNGEWKLKLKMRKAYQNGDNIGLCAQQNLLDIEILRHIVHCSAQK